MNDEMVRLYSLPERECVLTPPDASGERAHRGHDWEERYHLGNAWRLHSLTCARCGRLWEMTEAGQDH